MPFGGMAVRESCDACDDCPIRPAASTSSSLPPEAASPSKPFMSVRRVMVSDYTGIEAFAMFQISVSRLRSFRRGGFDDPCAGETDACADDRDAAHIGRCRYSR